MSMMIINKYVYVVYLVYLVNVVNVVNIGKSKIHKIHKIHTLHSVYLVNVAFNWLAAPLYAGYLSFLFTLITKFRAVLNVKMTVQAPFLS